MKQIKFRASSAGHLMANPRAKKAREAGELSQTAKTYIQNVWLRENYGYDEPVVTNQMLKGHLCEQDSMGLVSKLYPSPEFRKKNKRNYINDWFTGTPDVILALDNTVEDLKTCWDLRTYFEKMEVPKLYYTQGQVYMDLTGARKFRLHYCLINTPEELILEEEKRFWFRFGCDDENKHYQQISRQLRRNHHFDHIPIEQRVKTFTFDYDEAFMAELKKRIEKARSYYATLSLTMTKAATQAA